MSQTFTSGFTHPCCHQPTITQQKNVQCKKYTESYIKFKNMNQMSQGSFIYKYTPVPPLPLPPSGTRYRYGYVHVCMHMCMAMCIHPSTNNHSSSNNGHYR
jgi:hypothetical protein